MVQYSKWQVILVAAVLLLGLAFLAPNFLKPQTAASLPSWVPNQQINLGLDLQGGSYLMLEVDVDAVLQEQLESLIDSLRSGLRKARIGYTNLGIEKGAVTFQVRDPATIEKARAIARDAAQQVQIDVSDNGTFHIAFTEKAIRDRQSAVVQQSLEIVRRRIDETGTREPSIQRQGDRRIMVQLPGLRDPERIKRLLGKTAKLTFRFVDEKVPADASRIPPGTEILTSDELDPYGNPRRYVVKKRVMVSGDTLTNAAATFQQGQPVVSFTFDSVGAKRFADATRDNVGKIFAIVLDNKVISD